MTTPPGHDHLLDQHLRRTLVAVAATVQEGPAEEADLVRLPSRRRRRLLVGAGVTIAAVPLAAAALVRFGPEYVDRMPPASPIVTGSLDGERYWVVDGRESPRCQGFPSGVELVAEEHNVVGQEWNTVGSFFGEPTEDGCAPRLPEEGPEYTYYSDGGLLVGDGMVWMGALHPDVDRVRVSLGGGKPFDAETFGHEGGRYYVLEVPPGTGAFTVEYLVDGEVVVSPSGETGEHVWPGE
jgi:hypothetical protein